jgi:uncharacterized protein (DUF362 family)
MDRRVFLQNTTGVLGGLAAADALSPLLGAVPAVRPDLTVAKSLASDVANRKSIEKIVKAAIDALGGIRRFISRNDVVVIKPNIGWDRVPETAANTNPDVVAALVKLCLEARAKKVKVFDRTSHDTRRAYLQSGIEAAAKAAGAEVTYVGDNRGLVDERRFRDTKIPDGVAIKSWPIYIDALEADKIINVPVAKQHSVSKLTMTFKNMMGVMGGNRGQTHQNIDVALVDLATIPEIKPCLSIIDAVRILIANGPTGGSPDDVKCLNTIIAGTDQVALDSYGATLFDMTGEDLGFVAEASKRGLGQIDLSKVNIKHINV